MNSRFSQYIVEAANIKESGRWRAMNEKIVVLAKSPRVDNGWQVGLLSALSYQVFSEYRRLEDARLSDPIDPSLLAWRSRNLFELSVWCTYFARSRENARRLYEDAGRDATDLLNAFERWGQGAGLPDDWHAEFADSKNDPSRQATSEGIDNLDGRYMRVEAAARECGLEDKFTTMNKLLSKFAHPTAMKILGIADNEKQLVQRETFYALGCCFFLGAFNALEKSVPFIGD